MAASDQYSRQRGAALIATLLAAALLLIIGAIASQQAVVSWLVGHRMRESSEALIAAESGLALAIADFDAEPSFDRFDVPEGSPFPYAGPRDTAPLPHSFRIRTEIRHRTSSRIDFATIANGRNRSRRVVAATIERSDAPYVPAALFFGHTTPSVAFSGRLTLSGVTSANHPVPAIATPSGSQAEGLHDQLVAGGARLTGGSAATRWSAVSGVVQRLRADAGELSDTPLGAVPNGLWASPASVDVGAASGSGVWLVDGDLSVGSSLNFEGLLLVLGDIHVAEGARLDVTGALALLPPGQSLHSRGETTITYRATPLEQIESIDPTLLGRRAQLIGWRDDS